MKVGGVENVILGALNWGPRTGYEIKQLVDSSTRFFWAASYGQIYPELRRLQERGLIAGSEEPQGGRRRISYTLTDAGREALRDWLREAPDEMEVRCEGLLKLFFASELEPAETVELARAMRTSHEATLARLREVERSGKARGHPALVLEFGVGLHTWIAAECRRLEARLATREEAAS